MTNTTKPIWMSRTFWSAVLMLVGTVLHLFGVEFPEDEQASVADQIVGLIPAAMELVGFVGVIWGRLNATKAATVTGRPRIEPVDSSHSGV